MFDVKLYRFSAVSVCKTRWDLKGELATVTSIAQQQLLFDLIRDEEALAALGSYVDGVWLGYSTHVFRLRCKTSEEFIYLIS